MPETYSYLGPAGTFTEAALRQVPEAVGKTWRSVNNVGEALDDVVEGRSVAAMIAIENSVEGGVSATQDALASIPNLRIVGEYLVPVNFVLVARPGTALADVVDRAPGLALGLGDLLERGLGEGPRRSEVGVGLWHGHEFMGPIIRPRRRRRTGW